MGNKQTTQPQPAPAKTSSMYFGMVLDPESRQDINDLLHDLGVSSKAMEINHHCTVVFNPAWQHCSFSGLPGRALVTGVLVSQSHVVIELSTPEVKSFEKSAWAPIRPVMDLISDTLEEEKAPKPWGRKGQRYHVTHSMEEGCAAKDSNLLLTGEVEAQRHPVNGRIIFGEFRWVNNKGEEFSELSRLKKGPALNKVGLGHTVFSGVGSYHSGDGGLDLIGSMSEDILRGNTEIAFKFEGLEGCGPWPMTKTMGDCVRVGMVLPKGRPVTWAPHRDDTMPVVSWKEVTEKVDAELSSVLTYSLPVMLLDNDCARENGDAAATDEAKRMIISNSYLWIIAVIANGDTAPITTPPPSVHRCLQKIKNGEPLPEGETERARSFWFSETNPGGWVLVDYRGADEE